MTSPVSPLNLLEAPHAPLLSPSPNTEGLSGGELYVGLMSGTSLDGVDAVLVDFSAGGAGQIRGQAWLAYPDAVKQEVLALHSAGHDELARSQQLAQTLARLYAEAVQQVLSAAGVVSTQVRAMGCHGQTIRHQPQQGYSLQLNAPAYLAELTGIAVVADFRMRDIAAGGQGAPLVPAFHAAAFGREQARVVVNIGGMSNLTELHPQRPVRGWDCGPGNVLLDGWIGEHLQQAFDRDGAWATSGQVIPSLLEALLAHPFCQQTPPKSCGREDFHLGWLRSLLQGGEAPQDVQATLLALTAQAIAGEIRRECCPDGQAPAQVVLCGGGAHNTALRQALVAALPESQVILSDELGVAADWLEAQAFAWLARQCVLGLPGNLPEVTGARGLRVLGAIYPA